MAASSRLLLKIGRRRLVERKEESMRWLVVAAAAALMPGAAAAQDCRQQVDAFAAEMGVSTDLPKAGGEEGTQDDAAESGSMSDELAQSGGVIEPPETGSEMPTLEPPPGAGSDMPTSPEILPDSGATPGSPEREAARQSQIQSLLVSARRAADAGEEQRCLTHLQEAKALAAEDAG